MSEERCHCHFGCGGDGWDWAHGAREGSTPRDDKGVTVYCVCPAGAELREKERATGTVIRAAHGAKGPAIAPPRDEDPDL